MSDQEKGAMLRLVPSSLPEEDYMQGIEDDPSKAGFVIVYGAVSFSGFLMGLLVGWIIWG
jgi:hypothetical protein